MTKREIRTQRVDVGSRLNALHADLVALQYELKSATSDVADLAGDRAATVIGSTENAAQRAHYIAEESSSQMQGDVEEWPNGHLAAARDSVRTRPLLSMALSMGAGTVLAAIFLRR